MRSGTTSGHPGCCSLTTNGLAQGRSHAGFSAGALGSRTRLDALTQRPPPPPQKPTLEQFIGQNDKLLGAMAVFTALAAFTKDLQAVGGYLSFTFIAATVLVWFELLRKFPKQSGTGTLFWFENLMSIGILGLAAYL